MLGTRVMMSQAVGKSGARETQRVTRISARVEKNPRFFCFFLKKQDFVLFLRKMEKPNS